MIASIFTVLLIAVSTQAQLEHCKQCGTQFEPVCGKDGETYTSYCVLLQQECMRTIEIGFACDGECPCDPEEVKRIDEGTFKKLYKLREDYQLERHEEEEKRNNDYMIFDVLDTTDDKDMKKVEQETVVPVQKQDDKKIFTKKIKMYNDKCPSDEMSELPSRLIDWFHVLKTNEKVKEFADQGIEQEPILKEMNFMDSKLKSMYSALACSVQDTDELEKEVCLTPVQWMFHHLDSNNDQMLSAIELYEIEQINNEHCIKPFLKNCDSNGDGKVVLKEFCKCLCITPPCTKVIQTIPSLLIGGEPRPVPNLFTPSCDEDGFFMPTQCNKRLGVCWCVDRNGNEYEGTRKLGKVACILNTMEKADQTIVPLDVEKENSKDLA